MGEWRGDLTSMTVQGFLRVVFFLGMAWLLGKAFPKAEPMRMPVAGPTGPARPQVHSRRDQSTAARASRESRRLSARAPHVRTDSTVRMALAITTTNP